MLRSTATRTFVRSFVKAPTPRSNYVTASATFQKAIPLYQVNKNRPRVLRLLNYNPATASLYATRVEPPQFDKHDPKVEQKVLDQEILPAPEDVSIDSSVRHVFEHGQGEKEETNVMTAGIKADLQTIKETFALTEVPKEPLYLGLAGVIPYAATSLSTYYLAWDINHSHDSGTGYLFTPETAHQLLDIVAPIQIGYGAVLISFLGAIHWGMEYAGYGGHHGYRRYVYGVLAPAVAWPTIYMPLEYALITQFLSFIVLYFVDARATVRGWLPPWYATYRFILTAFVGVSIVVSLVGHGQVVKHDDHLRSPVDYVKEDRDAQWVALEREERERRQALVDANKAEEEEEEEKDAEEGDADESTNDEKGNKNDGKKGGKR